MNKLYFYQHTFFSVFNKSFLLIVLLLFLIQLISTNANANAQCNNSNLSGTVNAPTAGNTVQINNCAFAGDYSIINNVPASTSFTVTSSVSTDFITIRQGTSGGPVIAFGSTTLTWTSTLAGTYYLHINTDAFCGIQAICRTTAITCNGSCMPPVVTVTPNSSCGGVINGGPCNALTASGADTYTWFPISGLYMDCAHSIPYIGQNTAVVYAAPIVYTVYTVTGTITATGCTNSATAFVNYTPPAPFVTLNPTNMCLGDPAVKLKIVSPDTMHYCSGGVNLPVPNNNVAGVTSSVLISGVMPGCTIMGMSVTINMTHTRIGDMVFVLKAPNGKVLNLDYHISGTGGSGNTIGFLNTVISSNGSAVLSSGINPYNAVFRADEMLVPTGGYGPTGPTGIFATTTSWNDLYSSINGTWTLGMYDGVGTDSGILNSWCLNIITNCSTTGNPNTTQGIWTPISGLYIDSFCTVPYFGIPIDSVWTKPIQEGIYTYQVTTNSLPNPPVSFTNTTPISIADGGTGIPYPANITVSGLPVTGVSVKSVILNGITHTLSEDIDVILQSPSGQNVVLMSDVGAGTALLNNAFTFDDSGSPMSTVGANSTGTYKPTNYGATDNFPAPGPGIVSQVTPTISMFGTGNQNGLWKLFVVDDDGNFNQGDIAGGFTINFDIGLPACTSPPRSVVVSVGQPALIITQPIDQNICFGDTAIFSVVMSGPGPFVYQWQVSNAGAGGPYTNIVNADPYSGINTATLTINKPPVNMSGQYYKVIINGGTACGVAASIPALLNINALPTVVISANPLTVLPGMPTTIHSSVSPNIAATYTWLYNGIIVAGAITDSLLVDVNGLGDYQLRVTDVNGCNILSNIITIAHGFALNLYVYPNPTNGQIEARYYLDANIATPRSLIIYNNRGEKVLTKSFVQTISYQKISIDIRSYGKGLYWISLVDKNGKRIGMSRVIVQ